MVEFSVKSGLWVALVDLTLGGFDWLDRVDWFGRLVCEGPWLNAVRDGNRGSGLGLCCEATVRRDHL